MTLWGGGLLLLISLLVYFCIHFLKLFPTQKLSVILWGNKQRDSHSIDGMNKYRDHLEEEKKKKRCHFLNIETQMQLIVKGTSSSSLNALFCDPPVIHPRHSLQPSRTRAFVFNPERE